MLELGTSASYATKDRPRSLGRSYSSRQEVIGTMARQASLEGVQLVLCARVKALVLQHASELQQLPARFAQPLLLHARSGSASIGYSTLESVAKEAESLSFSSEASNALSLGRHTPV